MVRFSELQEYNNANNEPKVTKFSDLVKMRRAQQDGEEQFDTSGFVKISDKQKKEWEGQGPIGFFEQARRQDKTEMIPFNPEGAVKSVKLLNAVNRIKKDEYKGKFGQKAQDIDLVNKFLYRAEEERIRGFKIGGQIARGVSALPAFMIEFLATGGAASLGKKAVAETIKGSARQIAKSTTKKAIARTAGALAGSVARTVAMPHRLVQGTAERQLNASLELTDEGIKIAQESEEKPLISFAKAFGDLTIENFSEVTGPVLSKAAGRVVPKKMANAISKMWKKLHPNESINKLFTKAGYNGFLEELGEERVGALLRAVFNVEDFGAADPDKMLDRVIASVPNGEELLVEAGVLSFPGMTKAAASRTMGIIKQRKGIKEEKVDKKDIPDEKIDEIVNLGGETFEAEQARSAVVVKALSGQELSDEEKTQLSEIHAKFVDEGLITEKEIEKVEPERKPGEVVIDEETGKPLEIQPTEEKIEDKPVAEEKPEEPAVEKKKEEKPEKFIDKKLEKQIEEAKKKERTGERPKLITKKETTLLKNKIKDIRRGFKRGVVLTKKEVKSNQRDLINIINASDLPAEDKGKFLKTVKNIQTPEQLEKALPKIEERIGRLLERQKRKKLVKKILKQPKKPEKAVDVKFQEKIDSVLEKFGETKKERKQSIKTLSTNNLENLERLISGLSEEGRQEFKSKKQQREMASDIIRAGLVKNTGGMPDGTLAKGTVQDRKRKEATPANKARIGFLRPLRMVREVFGKLGESVFYDSIDAADTQKNLNATDRKLRLQESMRKNKVDLVGLGETITIDDKTYQVNDILRMYMATKDKQSMEALMFGNNLLKEEIDEFIDKVKQDFPSYIKFADEVQGIVGERFDQISQTMENIFNQKLKKVKEYFPIRRLEVDKAEEDTYQGVESELLFELAQRSGPGFKYTSAEKGFTISREDLDERFQREISLDFLGDAVRAIENQEHFLAFSSLQKAFNKTLNDKAIRDAVVYNHTQRMWENFNEYLNVVINPSLLYAGANKYNSVARKVRRGLSKAFLGFNVVTAAKQLPSLGLALKYTTPKDMAMSMTRIALSKKARDDIFKLNPALKNRVVSRDINEILQDIQKLPESRIKRNLLQLSKKVDKKAFEMIMNMDKYAVLSVYDSVYRFQRKTKSQAEAMDIANKAVLETQPQAATKDLPAIYRTNNEYLRMITMFTNQLNQIWNMISADLPAEIAQKEFKRASVGLASIMMSSLGIYIASHGGPPEDQDDWFDALFGSLVSSIPIMGNWGMSIFRGYDPSISPADSLVRNLKYMQSNLKNENYVKALQKALFLVAVYAEMPFSQLKRTSEGLTDLISGKSDDLRRLIWSKYSLSGDKKSKKKRSF